MHVISPSAGADLIHAKSHMDQKHERNCDPVIEFRENRRQGVKIVFHFELFPLLGGTGLHTDHKTGAKHRRASEVMQTH